MKKLSATLCLCCLAAAALAQGTVSFVNGTYAFARTNDLAFGGTAGNTAPVLGGFVYGLFTAPSTVTTIDSSLQDLFGPNWQFTGLYATNTSVPTGGRLLDGGAIGASGAPAQGWMPGQTNSFIIVGWSTSIAGQDWNSVANQLRGAIFHAGGVWSRGGFSTNANAGSRNMFLGATTIGFGMSGDPNNGLPAFPLFGQAPTVQGNPISSPFDMFIISVVPEPGLLALAGVSAAALLISRRRRPPTEFAPHS
jgi:hypothetical protein